LTGPPSLPSAFNSDRPIGGREEDLLDRAPFADALADELVSGPADDSYVLGLVGPWGSGKSSILSMVRETLRGRSDVVVVDFNAWLFSGAQDLLVHFFNELSAVLGKTRSNTLSAISEKVDRYGKLLRPLQYVPVVGSAASATTDAAAAAAQALQLRASPSIQSQRDELRTALAAQRSRIVVLIDDVDRLRPDEIREIVRLVRLVGDFPRISYLLAFDRLKVEAALGDAHPENGRAYLEKIVQLVHDLPPLRREDLATALTTAMDAAINAVDHGPFHEDRWPDLRYRVLDPMFTTLREVRRYANALPLTLRLLGAEVALEDVLILEVIRVQLPDVHALLAGARDELTGVQPPFGLPPEEEMRAKARVTAILEAGGELGGVVERMLELLFPASAQVLGATSFAQEFDAEWRRDRRVADSEVLSIYLAKSLPAGTIPVAEVDAALRALGDSGELDRRLAALDVDGMKALLQRLLDYRRSFTVDQATAALPVLLNHRDRFSTDSEGIFDWHGDAFDVGRVVLRLIEAVPDEDQRFAVVQATLPLVRSLSSWQELVRIVGRRPGSGHELVTQEQADALEQLLARRIMETMDTEALAQERDLARLLAAAREVVGEGIDPKVRDLVAEDHTFVELLRAALSKSHSARMGSVAMTSEWRLSWDWLERVVGRDRLPVRIDEAARSLNRNVLTDRTRTALELAERYRKGWRPSEKE
jgi:hypothetical protein